MDDQPTRFKDETSREVQRYLVAMIADAHQRAHDVIKFLAILGYKKRKRLCVIDEEEALPTGPAADFLARLAAVVRVRKWELAGLHTRLPPGLPTANEAMAAAVTCAANPNLHASDDGHQPVKVFRVWTTFISRAGRAELRSTISLPPAVEVDRAIDHLADFLWANRNSSNEEVEQCHEE